MNSIGKGALAAMVVLGSQTGTASVLYNIQALPLPSKFGPEIEGVGDIDINNFGEVIAAVTTLDHKSHAVLWSPGSQPTDLFTTPWQLSVALNNVGGGVLGTVGSEPWTHAMTGAEGSYLFSTPGSGEDGVGWSPYPIDLGPWTSCFVAMAINDTGYIVGGVQTPEWTGPFNTGPMIRPVLLDHEGRLTVLDAPPQQQSLPLAINDSGQIVGAVRWDDGLEETAWTLDIGGAVWNVAPGSPMANIAVVPRDINEAGAMAGIGSDSEYQQQPVVLEADGALRFMSIGGDFGSAIAINESGTAVGYVANVYPPDETALVGVRDGEPHALIDLIAPWGGWTTLDVAYAINDLGQIVGVGTLNGQLSIFLATPVLFGDVNLDGLCDALDISPFVQRVTNGSYQAEADCNNDGAVNALDIAKFIYYVTGCAGDAQVIPEPASLALLAFLSLGVLRRR